MAKQARVYRTELSPVSFLTRNAYVFPDKTAVVHDQRRYTYRQFEERVNRLASGLRRGGLQKHDRVAFLCPNIPPMLEAHFGVPAAGGILVSINTRLGTDEIGYILKHSGSKSLFVDAELESLVKPLDLGGLKVVRVDDTGSPGDPYEDFLRTGSAASVESWFEDEDETLSINYTSGTTGQPKGVMYTHRGAYLNAVGEILESGMSWDTKYLWTLPMFHCNGWCFTWGVTAVAGTHICLRKVDPERIWDLFETEGITHYNGAPTVQTAIVNHPKAHRLARPVTVTVAAAPPSPTLLARLKELNLRPVHAVLELPVGVAALTVDHRRPVGEHRRAPAQEADRGEFGAVGPGVWGCPPIGQHFRIVSSRPPASPPGRPGPGPGRARGRR